MAGAKPRSQFAWYFCVYIYIYIYIYVYIYIYIRSEDGVVWLWRSLVNIYILYQGFISRTLMTHKTAREVRGPSFIPFYHFHPLTNIQTFILQLCTWGNYHIFLIAPVLYTRLILDEITTLSYYYLIDRWCDIDFCLFICWFDSKFLLQLLDTGNRWSRTRIDYQFCITSKPTNQVY